MCVKKKKKHTHKNNNHHNPTSPPLFAFIIIAISFVHLLPSHPPPFVQSGSFFFSVETGGGYNTHAPTHTHTFAPCHPTVK